MNYRTKKIINERRRNLGRTGETLVMKHLKNKGFIDIESNYRRKYGEIDLIMENAGKLHFIEVKSVSRENFTDNNVVFDVNHETNDYRPEQNVSAWKIRKLARMIKTYLEEKALGDKDWQLDVAVVYLDRVNRRAIIKFLKDILINE